MMKKHVLAIGLALLLTKGLAAEAVLPQGASPELVAKLAEAQQKVRDAEQSPLLRRLKEISAQRVALNKPIEEQQAALDQEAGQYWEKPEWVAYNEARQAMEELRNRIEDEAHERIFSRAKTLYVQRHQELRALAAPDLPQARRLGLDVLSYPRVDGSTSMQPLATIACSRILGSAYGWVYAPSRGRMIPREVEGYYLANRHWNAPAWFNDANHYRRPQEFSLASTYPQAITPEKADSRLATIINGLLVRNTGTNPAYLNLITGKSDLALLARKPSADELAEAAKQGVELALAPIGWDALVFIVNEKNPVTGLSQQQIRSIYDEKVTSWKDLAGNDAQIVPFRRERNSGSQELYEELLLAGKPMAPVSGQHSLIANGMGGPFNLLFEEKNGLAYSVFCYEHFMAASPFTRVLAVDGVEPSLQTIANGQYPLRFPVYAVYRKGESAQSPAMRLLEWLRGPEGQQVIREAGLAPLKSPGSQP